ncbi:MAG: HDIG domain-containing protein [Planctomycetia bacterium]|nr:HDIG domain-containing protein [Planctomycetia bacterium]
MFGPTKKTTRLAQWNEQQGAANHAGSWWRVWQHPALHRCGMVLLSTAAVALLVCAWGPPMPYRVGEVYPSDLRVRVYFEVVNQPQTEWRREEAVESLPARQGGDPLVREEARRAVAPVIEKYPPGMPLVRRGEPITERQMTLLQEEHRAYLRSLSTADLARRSAALFLIIALLVSIVVLYVARFQPALAQSGPKIVSICVLVVSALALALLLSRPPWQASLVPLAVTAMVLTIAYNAPFALLMSFSMTLIMTVALGTGLPHLLIMMGGLATAVMLLPDIRRRSRLVEVGFGAGLGFLAMTWATGLLSNQTIRMMLTDGGRNLIWGVLAGYILAGSLPLVERVFGIVTDITLLKLADGSHPLLQELVRRAPGTYIHSITVATLAESAAKAIGANGVLARVGSYFHDIGKMLKPHYFVENQDGENRHDYLEPALSTLIIIGHVKDGLELAEQYKLPRPIVEFIQQHHGTTLVEYFYREAMRIQEENGHGATDLEASFRYPGPKPQNRENGIVMLADAVESASRALREPAPSSLRKLVHDMLMKRLLDGQFEESRLTLTELHLIEESLCKSLIALYHSRIRYPDAKEKKAAA